MNGMIERNDHKGLIAPHPNDLTCDDDESAQLESALAATITLPSSSTHVPTPSIQKGEGREEKRGEQGEDSHAIQIPGRRLKRRDDCGVKTEESHDNGTVNLSWKGIHSISHS